MGDIVLARYLPAIDIRSRLAVFGPRDAAIAATTVARFLGLEGWSQKLPTGSGRQAIAAYFGALAAQDARRTVLLSAQLCPIVPLILVKLGFRPLFVDIAGDAPTPSVAQMVAAFEDAGGAQRVAAAILSPVYGYLPRDFDELAGHLPGINIVLDLAQATLLSSALPKLMTRADAAIFSFGIGKGLDIGGGLLAVRGDDLRFDALDQKVEFSTLAGLPSIIALRAIIGLGVYRYAIGLLDSAIEAEKSKAQLAIAQSAAFLSKRLFHAAAARLPIFADEIKLARERAQVLYRNSSISRHCRNDGVFGDASQMHLRQIIRLADGGRRADALHSLQRRGIDALPAGEPLPGTYLTTTDAQIVPSSEGLPQTRQFLSDAIRLPFLGRIDRPSFTRLVIELERALD